MVVTTIYRTLTRGTKQSNLSKSTDHGTDVTWSIYGGDRHRELEYLYGTEINRAMVDRGRWSAREVLLYTLYKWSILEKF